MLIEKKNEEMEFEFQEQEVKNTTPSGLREIKRLKNILHVCDNVHVFITLSEIGNKRYATYTGQFPIEIDVNVVQPWEGIKINITQERSDYDSTYVVHVDLPEDKMITVMKNPIIEFGEHISNEIVVIENSISMGDDQVLFPGDNIRYEVILSKVESVISCFR